MLLFLLIITPFLSSIFSFFSYRIRKDFPRWMALIGMIIISCIAFYIFFAENYHLNKIDTLFFSWIPRFGINFSLTMDGFSLLMVLLTGFLGIIAILCSWNDIQDNQGFFYFNLMLILTGIIGVFISCDLFLFFLFWEIILIPMYFLIILWGKEKIINRIQVANKFIIYMQSSSLIMLMAILGLVLVHYNNTHILTFDYNLLANTVMNPNVEFLLMLGFFLAFSVKMPIFPFHGWATDVYIYSPTCGALDIVGILLKTAPYALLRYNFILFPHATKSFTVIAIGLGLLSFFYGSFVAFTQNNIKRLIAYSSFSHMGLIMIAIYSNNIIAMQGSIIQMLANSISTAALCILSGQLYTRLHTQNIFKMGGLWKNFYWIPGFTLFFSLANLGIPGTGNFIGEFLILFGLFNVFPIVSVFATIGMVFSAIYSLNMIQRIYYGISQIDRRIFSVNKRETVIIMILLFSLLLLGLYPNIFLDISYSSIQNIQKQFNDSISTIRF